MIVQEVKHDMFHSNHYFNEYFKTV